MGKIDEGEGEANRGKAEVPASSFPVKASLDHHEDAEDQD
jgi:hypothetical protein